MNSETFVDGKKHATPAAWNDMTSTHGNTGAEHIPVMLNEALDLLNCTPGGVYVDATVGLGGHSLAILERIRPGGFLLGIDRDRESLEKASFRLKAYEDVCRLLHENYKNLPLILNNLAMGPVDGILLDLGVSSCQLMSPERGFSFHSNEMLDMRMDRTQQWTAADLVNTEPQEVLADIIYRYGEERLSRRIAAAIVRERSIAPITRCSQLADIVGRAHRVKRRDGIHPATKTFQALRIAVNEELEGLEQLIVDAAGFLKPGGRLVVIAFHSLEDRIVKKTFRRLAGQCICDAPPELCRCPRQESVCILTPRPISPGHEELKFNPRARSARLRAIERR
ncbi:MAG TPA: 16S rRNA (cytosine(1402)-N(4))-methyltransferase RsmH [Acidobacteriota bacterium]|nr:16S rRNA (cytosine(1402)-N(4))-methyltransferase RsmH [Acidobacteriota bacterium]